MMFKYQKDSVSESNYANEQSGSSKTFTVVGDRLRYPDINMIEDILSGLKNSDNLVK